MTAAALPWLLVAVYAVLNVTLLSNLGKMFAALN